MIEPVFPLAPKITYMASVETATLSLRLFMFVSPFCLSSPIRSFCNPDASGQSGGLGSELKANAIIRLNAERYDIRLS